MTKNRILISADKSADGNVVSDVEKMIEDMAQSLVGYDDRFNWREWPKLWNEEAI